MVPISKSIWQLILFVCANFYFVAITRFNSSFCFLKIFSRERSSPPPPNFAPPFCAFCLIVCDFLPKTWNLRRKEGKSAPSRENAMSGSPQAARHCSESFCRKGGCCTKQGAAASLFMKILHKRQKNLLLELLMYQICAILLDVSP